VKNEIEGGIARSRLAGLYERTVSTKAFFYSLLPKSKSVKFQISVLYL